jgi:pilus assembly protein CpaE
MHKLLVALVGDSRCEVEFLANKAEGRNAHVVFECDVLPTRGEDPAVRQLCDLDPELVAISVAAEHADRLLAAIRLLRSELPGSVICAVGASDQLSTIVRCIREGAADFIDKNLDREAFQDAIAGLASDVLRSSKKQGRIVTFMGSKGGCGATTLAVNTAIALQDICGSVILLDLAPHPHAALHLNVTPEFGIADALANLERMDKHLLDSFTVSSLHGLALLSGITHPMATKVDPAELLGLFDLLATRYDQIIVDCSGRADGISRSICYASSDVLLVALPNVCSLWSARRSYEFLAWEMDRERLHIVLNRCRKADGAAEEALQAHIWWQVPEGGEAVANSVECGTPILVSAKSDLARSIRGLAEAVMKTSGPKKAPGECIPSPALPEVNASHGESAALSLSKCGR